MFRPNRSKVKNNNNTSHLRLLITRNYFISDSLFNPYPDFTSMVVVPYFCALLTYPESI